MNIYELGNVKIGTYKKLDPAALTESETPALNDRLPADLLSRKGPSEATQAVGIAELLNSVRFSYM